MKLFSQDNQQKLMQVPLLFNKNTLCPKSENGKDMWKVNHRYLCSYYKINRISKHVTVYIMQIWIKAQNNQECIFINWGSLWTAILKGCQCKTNDISFSKLAWTNASAQTATQLVDKQIKFTLLLACLKTVKLKFSCPSHMVYLFTAWYA